MITAPFNFVPLSEEVFFPPWAKDVSHDIPFEDPISGSIDISITTKSPIFVKDAKESTKFCNHNGEFYIPSSSVKGMIRHILEILSFSKLSQDSYNDDTYAIRDLSSARNFYMQQMQKEVSCGWLKKVDEGYVIEDCGVAGRIRHEEIDKALNIKFSSKFKKNGFEKTAQYKYDLLKGTHKEITVGELYKSSTNPKYDKRAFCKYEKDGKKATLVVTGQPTPRQDTGKMGDGKGFEFVFFEKKGELKVTKEVFENFLFAYFNEKETQPKESPDWKFWKEKLSHGESVPVFFQKKANNILHFGLSYLYKLPYTHSVSFGIPKSHTDKKADLAQTIFGYINKDEALKGRVSFSHFKADSNIKELSLRTEILGTPRASYYPMYIQQDGKIYKTYMDSNFNISGRKHYPIHNTSKTVQTTKNDNEKVGVEFTPLDKGAVFRGKLRYHNLKKAELGAILSALTFHNTAGTFHNLGMAKSLGYGKVDITLNTDEDIQPYLKEFEMTMMQTLPRWSETKELKELFSMSIEQNNTKNSALKYMELKEFAKEKNTTQYLKYYTELDNIKTISPISLVSDQDLKDLEIQKLKDKQAKKLDDEYQETINSKNIQKIENFITKNPDFEKLDTLKTLKDELQKQETQDKFAKVNDTAKKAYDNIHNPKYKAKLQKALKDFIKKYEAKNKGSSYVLELVEMAKSELK